MSDLIRGYSGFVDWKATVHRLADHGMGIISRRFLIEKKLQREYELEI